MTIKDIARISGCSVSTISRVINDRPDVRPETKEKVLQMMRESGFVPNTNARQLKIQQSRSLVGIGTRASGTYDARMLPCFKKHVLRAAECLAQCAARSKPAVLKGTGHVHHGGKYHCRRITVGAGVLPHPVEYLLLACGIEHRHPVRRLVGSHLSRTIHAPAEQLQHLVVNAVNLLADFG